MTKLNRKILGFTLAEILITLAIIGVVAALTIPSLINYFQELSYKSALKKFYSNFAQATARVVQDNGGYYMGGPGSGWETSGALLGRYAKQMKFSNYKFNVLSDYPKDIVVKQYDGKTDSKFKENSSTGVWYNWIDANVLLSDGTYMNFVNEYGDCEGDILGNANANSCSDITVDINGAKKPNQWGKDVYKFIVVRENGNYVVRAEGDPKIADGAECQAKAPDNLNGRSTGCTYLMFYDRKMPTGTQYYHSENKWGPSNYEF